MDILIIERDEDSGETLKELLELHGYAAHTAYDREKALQVLGRVRPVAVIAEPVLSRSDGYALCRELRAHAGCRHAPFIALTGTLFPHRSTPADKGFEGWLLKPVEPETLLRLLEKLVNASRVSPSR